MRLVLLSTACVGVGVLLACVASDSQSAACLTGCVHLGCYKDPVSGVCAQADPFEEIDQYNNTTKITGFHDDVGGTFMANGQGLGCTYQCDPPAHPTGTAQVICGNANGNQGGPYQRHLCNTAG